MSALELVLTVENDGLSATRVTVSIGHVRHERAFDDPCEALRHAAMILYRQADDLATVGMNAG